MTSGRPAGTGFAVAGAGRFRGGTTVRAVDHLPPEANRAAANGAGAGPASVSAR